MDKKIVCVHCGTTMSALECRRGIDGESYLCKKCHRAEIEDWISDGLEPEELEELRRRVEDRLRKSPHWTIQVAAWMASEGEIRLDDF